MRTALPRRTSADVYCSVGKLFNAKPPNRVLPRTPLCCCASRTCELNRTELYLLS
ncbi:hypothetical protein BD414DRAFT_500124 [Trametes punicea]|nr:hypothetical protein BD414DRAFT_500124 [Trametes punicea]